MTRGAPAPSPPRRRLGRWLGCLVVSAALLAAWMRFGPLPDDLLKQARHVSTVVLDRNGEVLYETLSLEESRSSWLAPDHLPPSLVAATISAEDRRFFRHIGVDPLAIARAALRNIRSGEIREGGSTITQQVVKMLDRRRGQRGFGTKAREAILALRLEHQLSKREILALYLNLAPYGNQWTGAERASRGYFGRSSSQLTPAQAALLAALPQGPSRLDPRRHLGAARIRQRQVLSRMASDRWLNQADLKTALSEHVDINKSAKAFEAPHFVQTVLESIRPSDPPSRITTTLDATLQREVHGILAAQRPTLAEHGASHVAVVVLDNATSEWLAWEGSGDYTLAEGGAIDGAMTPRQPGSTLKPFTYALAFERGQTPAAILPDVPAHFQTGAEGITYSPRNYDGIFRGPLTARAALAGSENVPAVALLSRFGSGSLLGFLRRSGFTTLERTAEYYGLGLTLGNAEVRLDELVTGYSMFARGGELAPSRNVREVRYPDGRVATAAIPERKRLVSPETAFWIGDILSDASAREYVFGQGGSLSFHFPVAVKTGTSQSYRDNWTVGYTREVTVGVWVGNFDRRELRNSSGVTGAAPIFHQVMLAATRRRPPASEVDLMERPGSLVRRSVCRLSGLQPSLNCAAVDMEWLPKNSPMTWCDWHSRGGAVRWPKEYRAWAAEQGVIQSRIAASGPLPDPVSVGRSALVIAHPPSDATYLIDPTLRREYQTLKLRAAVEGKPRRIEWSIDGDPVGVASSDDALQWRLRPGEHSIRARDAHGSIAETRINVR